MQFLAGHSEYDVVEFAEWRAPGGEDGGPRGWVEVGLERCWGRGEGDGDGGDGEGCLRCMFLQVRVLENHQNGKDTHIRGLQIWARDERERGGRAGAKSKGLVGEGAGMGKEEMWEDEADAYTDGWEEGESTLR